MLKYFNETIQPKQKQLERSLGVKHINITDQSKTIYPSVWKVTHFTNDAGSWHINVNYLHDKYQNVHDSIPF